MSETTPEDHLIILHEFFVGDKTLATSSSIRALVNCSRVRVNCSHTSVKLHLSCTVPMDHPVLVTVVTQGQMHVQIKHYLAHLATRFNPYFG